MPLKSLHVTPPMRTSRRVLLVESHADTCLILATFMEHFGLEVECVPNAKVAFARALGFQPDAILIAIDYGDASSFVLCKQLRAVPQTADSFIVGLSTYAVSGVSDISDLAGFDQIFLKPMEVSIFIKAVQLHIRAHD